MSEIAILHQLSGNPVQRQNRWHHIDMPKANLRVLESPAGPFHKAECSVCGEKFYVPPDARDFKMDMLKQFDAHLFNQHRRRWDAQQKKRTAPEPRLMSVMAILRQQWRLECQTGFCDAEQR